MKIALFLVSIIFLFAWNNHQVGKLALVIQGGKDGLSFFVKVLPALLVLSIITGQLLAFYKAKPEVVRETIAGKSIAKAALLGVITIGVIPTGPLAKSEWSNGGNKFALMAFMTTMIMVNWTSFLALYMCYGGRITLICGAIGIVVTLIILGALQVMQSMQSIPSG
ncbi:MAG TPA: hypothetical protein VJC02_00665 [Candidatus Paceibacterota bacterium]